MVGVCLRAYDYHPHTTPTAPPFLLYVQIGRLYENVIMRETLKEKNEKTSHMTDINQPVSIKQK